MHKDMADISAMGSVVRAVERPDFYERLADAIRPVTRAHGVSAYLLKRDAAPTPRIQIIPDTSLSNRSVPTTAFSDWAYTMDPLYLAYVNGKPAGGYALKDLAPSNFSTCAFYKEFYQKAVAEDEVTILAPLTEEIAIAVYFVRSGGAAPYNVAEINSFKRIAPTIIECVRLHEERAARPVDPSAFARQWDMALATVGASILTPRERDVLRLTLHGHTARETAALLGISEGTAKNYRKKIYKRLGVASFGDLMTLFRHVAPYANGVDDPLDLCPNSSRSHRFP